MAKSLCVTYFLWLCGGFFGLHHVYLGRYKQAFIWWCLPGGYFGGGWLRDLWRIPEYVRDANNDPEYLKGLAENIRNNAAPKTSFPRLFGQLVVANMFGVVIMQAFPHEDDKMGPGFDFTMLAKLLAPAASALGVWVVGNIGREKGSIKWPLLACYLASPLFYFNFVGFFVITLSGMLAFHWKSKTWRKTIEKPTPFCKNFLLLFLCCGCYASMWGSYAYFNLEIVTKDGEAIKFRDAVGNFIKSPAFQEFSKNLATLLEQLRKEGWSSAWKQLIDSLDPLGERNALKVLQLKRGASQAEIKARYRELSKKWHPDRFKNQTEKAEAQSKFVEIQAAYEVLSDIKVRRSVINRRSNVEPESKDDKKGKNPLPTKEM